MDNSEIGSVLHEAMQNYQRMKLLDLASDRGLQFLQGRKASKLEEEERALSILEKKRHLGLPETSEDYERATNEGKSFYSMLAPSLGRRGIQAIPGPDPLNRVPHVTPKTAESIAISASDLLPFLKAIPNFGGRYGGGIGRLASAFSL